MKLILGLMLLFNTSIYAADWKPDSAKQDVEQLTKLIKGQTCYIGGNQYFKTFIIPSSITRDNTEWELRLRDYFKIKAIAIEKLDFEQWFEFVCEDNYILSTAEKVTIDKIISYSVTKRNTDNVQLWSEHLYDRVIKWRKIRDIFRVPNLSAPTVYRYTINDSSSVGMWYWIIVGSTTDGTLVGLKSYKDK